MATYYSHYEKALRRSATGAIVDGRLQGTATVEMADLANAADTGSAPVAYELFGPGDVQRLAAGAITRRFPAPGTSDAEETKLALVEFATADLAWRYTPQRAANQKLRPWLVLVVGRRSADEIVLRPDGRVTIGTVTQGKHPLADSWKWAHRHDVDGRHLARVLSPLDLVLETEYVACVVPAFTPSGSDSWDGTAAVACDLYDHWSFRTGPLGDFPDLAAKLRKADLDAIAAGGRPFGRAQVKYARRAAGTPTTVVLDTAGALRLPPNPASGIDPLNAPPDPDVAQEVSALTNRIVTPDGRGVVTAPRYDAPFADVDTQAVYAPGGWIDGMRGDPRARGAAGIGAWNVIEWQDRINDAAAAKAGDLAIAAQRIAHVALGVEASRSLWRRHMPADAVDRLAVLAPVLGRLPTDTSETVLDAVAEHTPMFGRALLSSAARRALRPGPARTARAQDGAGQFGAVLRAANACPPEKRDPADVVSGRDVEPDRVVAAIKDAVQAATDDETVASRIVDRLLGDGARGVDRGQLIAALEVLAPRENGELDRDAIDRFLAGEDHADPGPSVEGWPGWMNERAPREPCEPLDLVGLADAVTVAVDPTMDPAPAARRVLSTLPGFTHIGPVEIEPELDLPLWSFLSTRSPDWMLPGAGDLREHDVVGLSTNPAFVEALLVGANHQATAELRWRNLPLVTRWSPLRKFWQRGGGEYDIVPIKGWADTEPLGATALAPDGRGAEAVVAFKTPLFRRYPATVVYLYPADPTTWMPPGPGTALTLPDRKDPTFTGTIGDDITFFGFEVPPEDLKTHWVVLEEPPAGYRFYASAPVVKPETTAANVAYNRFALPVRVLIGPLLGDDA